MINILFKTKTQQLIPNANITFWSGIRISNYFPIRAM